MLYEAISQPLIFLALLSSGFISGFIIDLKKIILKINKKNQFIKHIFDFFSFFLIFFNYFLTNLLTNFGETRFYSIFVFLLSFAVQRFIITKFVAKSASKCYNKIKEKHNERKKT